MPVRISMRENFAKTDSDGQKSCNFLHEALAREVMVGGGPQGAADSDPPWSMVGR